MAGGTAPYNYDWSSITPTTADPEDLTGLNAGTYTVTVTDAKGCTTSVSVVILQSGKPVVTVATTNLNCNGVCNGTIDLTVTGGTAQYTYDWAHIPLTNNAGDLTGVCAGTYTVTITDANFCTTSTSVIITEPTQLTVSGTSTQSTCGLPNGTISITALGGTLPYTFDWGHINPSTNDPEDLTGLAGGTYNVTVTDAKGCTTNTAVTVLAPNTPTVTTQQVNILCNGGNNGSIDVTVANGVAPYNYNWLHVPGISNPDDLTNLTAGIYCLTVSDVNGCTTSTCVTITEPPVLAISATPTNATCNLPNGSINLTITGGTPSYNIDWSNVGGTSNPEDLTGLDAGIYTVTVTDLNGCTKTTTVTIIQLGPPQIIATATPTTCNGGNDGTITLQVANGQAPITYDWQHIAGTSNPSNLTGLTAGIYNLTVTDATGCTSLTAVTVTEPTPIVITAIVTQPTCVTTGAINITVTNGTTPYSFNWAHTPSPSDPEDLTGLSAGIYTVTVTDLNGCTRTASWTLTVPTPPTVTGVSTPVSCPGGNDGTITLTLTGGTQPVSYDWLHIPGANNPQNLIGLTAGTYCVTVTDGAGCTTNTCVIVNQPSPITITEVVTPAQCGTPTGAINITATGGTPGYVYDWIHIPGSPD